MAKIKEFFSGIGKKLKALPKGKQGRAFVRVLQFFAIMLVLTIFAKGASAVTLPEVTWKTMSTQQIRNADDYAGTVSATNKEDVKLPQGLTVQRVYAQPGATVAKGDSLVSFDTDTLQTNLLAARVQLQDLQIQLLELQKPFGQDDAALKAAREAQAAAQKAYDETKAAGDRDVAAAQQAVNDANGALSTANAAVETTRVAMEGHYISDGSGGERPPTQADVTGAYTQEKYAAFLDAKALYDDAVARQAQAQGAVNAANAALTSAGETARVNLEQAQKTLDAANEALAKAQKEYDEATPAHAAAAQKRRLEIQQKQKEIELQREVVAKLEEMSAQGGLVTAPIDGTVTAVTAAAGAVTGEADYVRISTGEEGYQAEFTVPQDKAREIKVGDTVSVKYSNYYWGYDARVTAKSMPGEGGVVTVRAQLSSTDFADGDAVTVTVVKEDRQYGNCVPIEAVRPDSDGTYYVLVLDERNSIVGTQTVARKVTVTITAQDKTYAAIDGLYENQPRIVVTSTKPIADGDAVRIAEASTTQNNAAGRGNSAL